MTPAEFFANKHDQIQANPDALGVNATYQFNLSGDDGGDWVIKLGGDDSGVATGTDESAQCVISMKSKDFLGMIDGSLNPQMAFMTGKLRVKGDMGLALKLQSILS
ncbi:MAG: SCP2 sterol-binding domain-containing protein [Deltaproteobacteria bacterium]|nr:SCP2 sterol-binding domain-containing protein [Deltaproteobacteria bacterium]